MDEVDTELAATGLDILSYNRHFGRYRISQKPTDLAEHRDQLRKFLERAFREKT